MDRRIVPPLRRAVGVLVLVLVPVAAGLSLATAAQAACDADPLDGVRRSVVSEETWVHGVSMSIAELPSIDGAEARNRFIEYWRRANTPARTKTDKGVEVTSVLRGACMYSLQLPGGGAKGAAAVYAVTDLRRPMPSLPREFEWPPAEEGDLLTDTVSIDAGNLSRVLSYRVEKASNLVANQSIRRLKQADWGVEGLTLINEQHFIFHARKRRVSVEVTIARDGTGSVVTMNFTQTDG